MLKEIYNLKILSQTNNEISDFNILFYLFPQIFIINFIIKRNNYNHFCLLLGGAVRPVVLLFKTASYYIGSCTGSVCFVGVNY